METVLVAGAGGYIGSNAAEYFAKAGYRVIGTVRNRVAERLTRLGIKTINIDLADAANLPCERFSCVRPCVGYGRGDTSITPRTVAYLKNLPLVFHFGKWRGRNRWPLAHVENVCRTLHAEV